MGILRLLDPGGDELEVVAEVGLNEGFLAAYRRVPVGWAPCGLAVAADGPVVIEDVEAEPTRSDLVAVARSGGYRASFTTPLRSRAGGLIGTITTCFPEPHRPTMSQARLVEVYARQAADFVENARLRRQAHEAARPTARGEAG